MQIHELKDKYEGQLEEVRATKAVMLEEARSKAAKDIADHETVERMKLGALKQAFAANHDHALKEGLLAASTEHEARAMRCVTWRHLTSPGVVREGTILLSCDWREAAC